MAALLVSSAVKLGVWCGGWDKTLSQKYQTHHSESGPGPGGLVCVKIQHEMHDLKLLYEMLTQSHFFSGRKSKHAVLSRVSRAGEARKQYCNMFFFVEKTGSSMGPGRQGESNRRRVDCKRPGLNHQGIYCCQSCFANTKQM